MVNGLEPGLALLAGALPAAAQQAQAPSEGERPPATVAVEEPPEPNRISASASATMVSRYISRGVAFSDRPSLQLSFRADVALPELTGGAVTDARVFVGSWNSLQHGNPGLGQPNSGTFSGWYETDLYAGAAVELRERWTVQAAFYRYESPSDSFAGYNDLELIVSFNDADFWEGRTPLANFSLSPRLRLAHEIGRPGRADAFYVQPSLTPSFDLGDPENPIRVAVPLVAGFSDDYFLDVHGGKQTFGFFRTGLTISGAPFPAAPGVRLSGGFDLWLLNDRVASGLGDTEFVGRMASWRF